MPNFEINSLEELQRLWDGKSADVAKLINETLTAQTNANPRLKALRDFVEQHAYGMGERSFLAMWELILKECREFPVLMEIGVHRGQILAAWRMIRTDSVISGLSPFDGAEMGDMRNYKVDVIELFRQFDLEQPDFLIKGYSDDPLIIESFRNQNEVNETLDVLYIDGGHSYETTRSDIEVYSPYVIPGGFLVIDDSANRFAYPWGYFSGIASVSKAVDHCLPPGTPNDQWEHIGAVVHNRIWRKKF